VTRSSAEHDGAARTVAGALSAWGRFRIVRRLLGGNRASVFLVVRDSGAAGMGNDDGARFVAKTTARRPEAVGWAAAVAERARGAGLAASGYLATPDGRWAVGGVTLQAFVAGRPATVVERRAALPRLRAFHDATVGMRQRPGFASSTALLRRRHGGDVDLDAMPEGLVRLCRNAWRPLQGRPRAAIHGDLNADNVLVDGHGRICLLDWDECRVDAALFDEAAWLDDANRSAAAEPPGPGPEARTTDAPAANDERDDVRRARLAWEVAACWTLEPLHARRVARALGWRGGVGR